jgi:hypothetical protein
MPAPVLAVIVPYGWASPSSRRRVIWTSVITEKLDPVSTNAGVSKSPTQNVTEYSKFLLGSAGTESAEAGFVSATAANAMTAIRMTGDTAPGACPVRFSRRGKLRFSTADTRNTITPTVVRGCYVARN